MNESLNDSKTFMFVLTHKCNLHCTYCYQNHAIRDSRSMEFDFVKEKIEEAFRTGSAKKFYFDFIGGEVFTEWPLFKKICEWIVSKERPIPYAITVSTNGTLITEEIKAWMRRHKDKVFLSLSLDGDDSMQFTNRGTNNYNIDYGFFFNTWPSQGIKMTLSAQTIPCLAKGIQYLHSQWNLGKHISVLPEDWENPISCNIAYGIDLSNENYFDLKRELGKLIDFYTGEGYVYFPASILNVDFTYFKFNKTDFKTCKYCGAGTNIACYDVDGSVYPCQFFIPLTMSSRHLTILPNFSFIGNVRDPACCDCPIETLCPTCYGNNFKKNFDPFLRDKSLCMFTKLTLLANCILQGKRILRKTVKSDSDLFTLRVIDHLYPILCKEIETFENNCRR